MIKELISAVVVSFSGTYYEGNIQPAAKQCSNNSYRSTLTCINSAAKKYDVSYWMLVRAANKATKLNKNYNKSGKCGVFGLTKEEWAKYGFRNKSRCSSKYSSLATAKAVREARDLHVREVL